MITQCYHLHDIITQSTSEKILFSEGEKSNSLDTSVGTVLEHNLPFSKETTKKIFADGLF